MALTTAFLDHAREIVEAINSQDKMMPSEVRLNNAQHDFLTGKANGFVCTVHSVPIWIDSTATDGQPSYKTSGGADQTIVVASESGDATF